MANEKRLIDADALIKSMREEDLLFPDVPWSTTGVQKQIDKLPTVDAVEVVNCGSCLFGKNECSNGWMWCGFWSHATHCGGYCHIGKRNDNET